MVFKRSLFLVLFLFSGLAWGQFTNVTGTVVDPNGLPYAGGTIVAVLSSTTTPTFTATGLGYTPPTQPTGLSATGFFLMRLADNTQLSPVNTKWNFIVTCGLGCVQPAGGKGSIQFTLAAPITISGATQDISTQLNAVAPALSTPSGTIEFAGAPTGTCQAGQTAVNLSSGAFFYCNAGTWSGIAAAVGSAGFSAITAGTNTNGLVEGTGGSITESGSGVVSANQLNGGTVPATATILGSNGSSQPIAAALPATDLFIGTAGNVPAAVPVSGDSTLTSAGVMRNVGINGVLLSGLGTGILKNTTITGVPSIAGALDFPTLNQNTSGTANLANNLAAAAVLPNGTACTTQALGDPTTDCATDAFVLANASGNISGLVGTLQGQSLTGKTGGSGSFNTIAQGLDATSWPFPSISLDFCDSINKAWAQVNTNNAAAGITGSASGLVKAANSGKQHCSFATYTAMMSNCGAGILDIGGTEIFFDPVAGANGLTFTNHCRLRGIGEGNSFTGSSVSSQTGSINACVGTNNPIAGCKVPDVCSGAGTTEGGQSIAACTQKDNYLSVAVSSVTCGASTCTVTTATNAFVTGIPVAFYGLGNATFLNGLMLTIQTGSTTTVVVPLTGHNGYGPTAETQGTVDVPAKAAAITALALDAGQATCATKDIFNGSNCFMDISLNTPVAGGIADVNQQEYVTIVGSSIPAMNYTGQICQSSSVNGCPASNPNPGNPTSVIKLPNHFGNTVTACTASPNTCGIVLFHTPMIDMGPPFGGNAQFGIRVDSILMYGGFVPGLIGIRNTQAQENSEFSDLKVSGFPTGFFEWITSGAQNAGVFSTINVNEGSNGNFYTPATVPFMLGRSGGGLSEISTVEINGMAAFTSNIATISRSNNIVTVTLTAQAFPSANPIIHHLVNIAATAGAAQSFNGSWIVCGQPDNGSCITPTLTTFTFQQVGPNESGTASTGTAQTVHNVAILQDQCPNPIYGRFHWEGFDVGIGIGYDGPAIQCYADTLEGPPPPGTAPNQNGTSGADISALFSNVQNPTGDFDLSTIKAQTGNPPGMYFTLWDHINGNANTDPSTAHYSEDALPANGGAGIATASLTIRDRFSALTTFGDVTSTSVTTTQLAAPSAPTITPNTTGATAYTYTLTAVDANGFESTASGNGTTATGNATPSNTIVIKPAPGVKSYNIYRTVGGGSQGKIGTATVAINPTGNSGCTSAGAICNNLYFQDTNLTASGSAPAQNQTGSATFNGTGTFAGGSVSGYAAVLASQTETGATVQTSGGMGYSSSKRTLFFDGGGAGNARYYIPGMLGICGFVTAANTTTLSGTTQNNLTGFNCTYPGSALTDVAKVIEIEQWGFITSGTVAGTLTMDYTMGGTACTGVACPVCAITTTALPASQTNLPYHFSCRVGILTTGSPATVDAEAKLEIALVTPSGVETVFQSTGGTAAISIGNSASGFTLQPRAGVGTNTGTTTVTPHIQTVEHKD